MTEDVALEDAKYAAFTVPIVTSYFAQSLTFIPPSEDEVASIRFTKKSGKQFTVDIADIVSVSKNADGITVMLLLPTSTSAIFPLVKPPERVKGMGLIKLIRHPDKKAFLIPRSGLVLYDKLPSEVKS